MVELVIAGRKGLASRGSFLPRNCWLTRPSTSESAIGFTCMWHAPVDSAPTAGGSQPRWRPAAERAPWRCHASSDA